MKIEGKAKVLSIYIGEDDHYQHRPLYRVLVERLRENGLAGATVLRGIEGFGKRSRIHTASLLRMSEDLPILVQVIDEEDKIEAILPLIDEIIRDGLVTLEDVDVITYKASPQ
jgi:hypothetical protein